MAIQSHNRVVVVAGAYIADCICQLLTDKNSIKKTTGQRTGGQSREEREKRKM
jgi:hypothetical protein